MYLDKLELQGFKSFANKTLLDFSLDYERPRIAAIVGPNGCGKSNLSDAVRWVLGEQSLKNLRGKKSEDVIFSGSDKKARLGLAEVSLYLNNEDKKAPVDYSEIVITRRLYRNGESEYLINKKKVRLQDILILLAKSNFGQKTYSVIGQGMADAILIASPRERKEFFDEAAGVKQYQLKRDQALNKLEISEENLKQAEGLLLEIMPRLRSLSRQVKKLEQREEIEKKLKELQKNYYGSLWYELEEKIGREKEKFRDLKKFKDQTSQELLSYQKELNNLEKEKSRSKAFSELEKIYENLLEKKNQLKEEELTLKNKIELEKKLEVKNKISLPLIQIISLLEEYFEKQDRLIKKIYLIKTLEEFNITKQELFLLNEELGQLVAKIKNPQKNQEIKIDPSLAKKIEKISLESLKINQEIETIQNRLFHFNEEEETKTKKFFILQKKFQNKQIEINNLNNKINEVQIEIARIETREEDITTEIKKYFEGVNFLEQIKLDEEKKNELREEINKLKNQLEFIGGIDPETIAEYKTTKERYDFLFSQSEDLKGAIKSTLQALEDLDQIIKKLFDQSFQKINEEFAKFFKILFGGGRAHLILHKEEETDDMEEINPQENLEKEASFLLATEEDKKLSRQKKVISGIEIIATPPSKKVKNINMLSGGERAMTSIALICAIIATNPSPFVILDEVDAALDEANSERFAKILDNLSGKTQFIVITHNRATMKKAGVLYGVTMNEEGVSKLLSINLSDSRVS